MLTSTAISVDAADFSARPSEFLGQIRSKSIDRLLITDHGHIVAILTAPNPMGKVFNLHEILPGTVTAPDSFDPMSPAFDGTMHAEEGKFFE